MEATAPFKLDELCRDWIDGLSGEVFYRKVLGVEMSLEGLEGPLIIQEQDPLVFAAKFFAAVAKRRPVVLANPGWRTKEQSEFDTLVASRDIAPGSILIPTGGTTGGVKLAIHDWESLWAGASAVQDFLGGTAVHASCVLSLHHVSGLMQLVRSFVSGGSIRFDERETAGRCLSLVPTQLHRMLQTQEGIRKMSKARAVFVGGAAMPAAVERRARELRLPVVPVYGMTETAAMIAAVPNRDFLAAPGAGAVVLGDSKISIDPDGSIRIRSRSLFKGYHGGSALDRREGFRTGDAGWLDGRGRLHLLGRMDRLINTGGEKVDPAEVREALLRIEGVEQARVVGEPDEEWGEVVVAYVAMAGGVANPSEAAILSALKARLSPYKIPKVFRYDT